jgi:lipoprotein-anchoring transpeptidase ErfK/SrfK
MTNARSMTLALALALACGGENEDLPETELAEEGATEVGPDENPESDEPEAPPTPSGPPKRIFANRFVVPVRVAPARDAERIGYLRGGAVLMAKTAEPVGYESCAGGWFELTTGGFVCNGRLVTAFEGRRLPAARPRPPSREDALPYEYGYVRRRVPMYRRPPTDEEAAEHEGYRIPGLEVAEGGEGAPTAGSGDGAPSEVATPAPVAEVPPPAPAVARTNDVEPAAAESGTNLETGEGGEEVDEGPTLATLMGDPSSVVARWLMRGFFVSLDRDFRRGERRYWRTQSNGFVPYTAIVKRVGSDFEGTVFPLPTAAAPAPEAAAEAPEEPGAAQGVVAPRLPYAWVMTSRATVYALGNNGSFRRGRGRVTYHEGFSIVAEQTVGETLYVQAADGRWFRDRDVRIARQPTRPDAVGPEEKWMDVNLSEQVLLLMEGDRPVFGTLISSGKADRGENPDGSWETLAGLFRVKSKHLTDTMDGDTAVDGPYSVDDVPYVMYFELAYALHSAFWHNGFGIPRSHGCVNLAPLDARRVFEWADPPLPEGWHSAYPTAQTPGTWIHVHGETPGRR